MAKAVRQQNEKLKGLSLRQPWAEQMIRGVKTVEYRERPVHYRGRIYIYASLGRYSHDAEAEFAEEVGYTIDDLPMKRSSASNVRPSAATRS